MVDLYLKGNDPLCLEPGDWIKLNLYDDVSDGKYLVNEVYPSFKEIIVIRPSTGHKISIYTGNLKMKYLGRGKKRRYGDFSILFYYITPYTKPKNIAIIWNLPQYS